MKKVILIVAMALACAGCFAAKSVSLTVGPFRSDHTDYPIVIYLEDYPEFSDIERSSLEVWSGRKQVASQLDDINGDGVPDQLAFLIDIPRGTKQTYKIKINKKALKGKAQLAQAEPEVYAEMYLKSKTPERGYTYHEAEGKQFYIMPVTEQTFMGKDDSYNQMHHHGVAFESALMAYRIYFDKKQTIDVYAKKTPRLELEACKWYPTDEQLADGFGDDVLRVSGYIGVGACKPFNGEKMLHFDDVTFRTQRIIAKGPLRTICEVTDKGWMAAEGYNRITVTTRYTMYARHRDVLVEVFFSSPVEGMCTGVQKIGEPNYFTAIPSRYAAEQPEDSQVAICRNGGIVASWGTAWPVNDTIKYAKETVGLAVYVPELDYQRTVQDKNNNLIVLQPGNYIRYYFTCVAQKENNPPVKTDEEFWEFVQKWAEGLEE